MLIETPLGVVVLSVAADSFGKAYAAVKPATKALAMYRRCRAVARVFDCAPQEAQLRLKQSHEINKHPQSYSILVLYQAVQVVTCGYYQPQPSILNEVVL